MGQKISDGKAFDAVAPAGQVINDGDLYRVGGWNGVAVGAKDAAQTDRTMSWEMDPAAIYSVLFPAALNPAVGARVYWATKDSTTFQRGDTNLQAGASATDTTGSAVVMVVKNAAGYAQVRVINP
jgi:predicted RecA/RadA family phage recombinase